MQFNSMNPEVGTRGRDETNGTQSITGCAASAAWALCLYTIHSHRSSFIAELYLLSLLPIMILRKPFFALFVFVKSRRNRSWNCLTAEEEHFSVVSRQMQRIQLKQ